MSKSPPGAMVLPMVDIHRAFTLSRRGDNERARSRSETTDASSAAKRLLGEREGGPVSPPRGGRGLRCAAGGHAVSGAGLAAGARRRPVAWLSNCRRVRNHPLGTQTLGLESGAEQASFCGQTGRSQMLSWTDHGPRPRKRQAAVVALQRDQAPASPELGVSSCPTQRGLTRCPLSPRPVLMARGLPASLSCRFGKERRRR